MKLNNKIEVEKFIQVVNSCEHDVYLKSLYGDIYNLKSAMSQYIAIGKLLDEHGDELELFANDREDEAKLMQFLISLDS